MTSKRTKWTRLLSLLLTVFLLAGCSGVKDASRREKSGEPSTNATVTSTPDTPTPTTAVTPDPTSTPTEVVTPVPTDTPVDTPTPEITEEPTPTQTPVPTVEPTPEVTPGPSNFASIEEEREAFDKYLDGVFVKMVGTNDLSLHYILEHPENYDITVDFDMTEEDGNLSDAYDQFVEMVGDMTQFNYNNLTEPQKVNYDRLQYEVALLERFKDAKMMNLGLLGENNNVFSGLSTMLCEYVILEEKDLQNFISNLKVLPDYFSSLYDLIGKYCEEDGLRMTQAMYDATIKNIDDLTGTENIIYLALKGNCESSPLEASVYESYLEEAKEVINTTIVPALEEFKYDFQDYKKYIADVKGLGNSEEGRKYYTYLIQGSTASNWSPEKMFEYLKGKTDDMLTELYAVMAEDAGAYSRMMSAEYGNSDFKQILEELRRHTLQLFPTIERTDFIVDALPKELRVDGVLAYFMPPQYDNPTHKVIRVNPDSGSRDIELFSTLAHEGFPGHLYQDEYFRAQPGFHIINQALSYTGYQEGWATMMGTEAYKWITDDNVAFMFDFDYTFSMCVLGLADIGINYYGWDLDKVGEFLDEYMLGADSAKGIYDMCVGDPGISLPYTFNHFLCLDIIDELTAKGMSKMEAYKAFLDVGPASFDVLRKHLGLDYEGY